MNGKEALQTFGVLSNRIKFLLDEYSLFQRQGIKKMPSLHDFLATNLFREITRNDVLLQKLKDSNSKQEKELIKKMLTNKEGVKNDK